ncbi:MAG: sigma 54-interacting transcriptional regulator [Candidatus Sumerlaeota bacterium]|nr:sigma 54-interacting transcriptional regulator [Candidatus Sumerlaeota bacterium]
MGATIALTENPASPDSHAFTPPAPERRPLVLVVDDDENVADTCRLLLKASGYEVAVADCLEAVKRVAQARLPDLALVDYYLGQETGRDVLQWLFEVDPDCTAIVMSGDSSHKAAVDTVGSGAFAFLAKPIEIALLTGQMEQAWRLRQTRLARRRLEEENRVIRERLGAVLDAVGEGLICVDAAGVIQEINRFARKLFAAAGALPAGATLEQIWPNPPEPVRNAINVAIASGQSVPGFLAASNTAPLAGKALIIQAEPVLLPGIHPADKPQRGALLCLRDVTRLQHLESVLRERDRYHGFIGRSPQMQTLYDNLKLAADTEATVLLMGESGTGKELAASALHFESRRADKPFLKINCAAMPESLLESELFGHTRGAFTGAIASHKGIFEAANGGTLFLDEIGDISPRLQLTLLRVIETKTFERIGDTRPQKVDVRLITATNADLKQRVRTGAFREDLFYRLNVISIQLPPLRERGDDIILLADYFVSRLGERLKRPIPRLSPEVYDLLRAYAWPGNVRQLENALEQAVLFCREDLLAPHHLSADILEVRQAGGGGALGASMAETPRAAQAPLSAPFAESAPGSASSTPSTPSTPSTASSSSPLKKKTRVTLAALRRAMEECGGNQSEAARILGVNRTTIWRKIQKLKQSESNPS